MKKAILTCCFTFEDEHESEVVQELEQEIKEFEETLNKGNIKVGGAEVSNVYGDFEIKPVE